VFYHNDNQRGIYHTGPPILALTEASKTQTTTQLVRPTRGEIEWWMFKRAF